MKNHRETLNLGTLDNFSNYAGEVMPDNFLILLDRNRDSDCRTESNFECALKELGGESESVRVDRFGHWACGWFEYLSVDKNNDELLAIAEDIESALSDYPVLDDCDLSDRESQEADEFWRDCFNDQERLEYVRDNRSQFDFDGYGQVIEVIRGRYFNGYASELIY